MNLLALALLVASVLAEAFRASLRLTRLPECFALAGLVALGAGLADAPEQAVLAGLFGIGVLGPPLAFRLTGPQPSLPLQLASLLAASAALAAAFALPGPGPADPAQLATVWLPAALALGALLAASGAQALPLHLAALFALALVALLPGLAGTGLGGGYGLPAAAPSPLFLRVAAGPLAGPSGADLLVRDLHVLPLRLAAPGIIPALGAAALLLGLVLAGVCLPWIAPAVQPGAPDPSGKPGFPRVPPSVLRLGLALAASVLLATAVAIVFALLGAEVPLPAASEFEALLQERHASALPEGWSLRLAAALPGLAGFTPRGAGLDLAMLLLAGGLALLALQGSAPSDRAPVQGASGPALGLALVLLPLATLSASFEAERLLLLPWTSDPRGVALLVALGLSLSARASRTRPWAQLLVTLAALALLAGLVAGGRTPAGGELFDALAVY